MSSAPVVQSGSATSNTTASTSYTIATSQPQALIAPSLHPTTLLHRLGNDYRLLHAVLRGLPHDQNAEAAAAITQLVLAVASPSSDSNLNMSCSATSAGEEDQAAMVATGGRGCPGSSQSSAAGSASPPNEGVHSGSSPSAGGPSIASIVSPSRPALLSSFIELLLTFELEEHLKGSPTSIVGYLRGNSVTALVMDRLLGGGALPPAAVSVPIYSTLLVSGARAPSTSFLNLDPTRPRGSTQAKTFLSPTNPNSPKAPLSRSGSSAALATLAPEVAKGASNSSYGNAKGTTIPEAEGGEDGPIEETVLPTPTDTPKRPLSYVASDQPELVVTVLASPSPMGSTPPAPTPPSLLLALDPAQPPSVSRPINPWEALGTLSQVAMNDAETLTPEAIEEGGRQAALRLGAFLTALRAAAGAWPSWLTKTLAAMSAKFDANLSSPPAGHLPHSTIFLNTIVLLRFIAPKIMQMGSPGDSMAVPTVVGELSSLQRKRSDAIGTLARILQKVANNQPCLPAVSICSSPKAGEDTDKLETHMDGLNATIRAVNAKFCEVLKPQIVAFYESLLSGEQASNASIAMGASAGPTTQSPTRATPFPSAQAPANTPLSMPVPADILMRKYVLRNLLTIIEDMHGTSPLTSSLHGAKALEASGYFALRSEGPLPSVVVASNTSLLHPTPSAPAFISPVPSMTAGGQRPRASSQNSSQPKGASSGDLESQWVTVDSASVQQAETLPSWEALVKHGAACMQRPVMFAHAHQFISILGPTDSKSDAPSAVLLVHGDLLAMSEQALLKDPNRSKALLLKYLPLHKGAHPLDGDLVAHLAAYLDLMVTNCRVRSITLVYFPPTDGQRLTFGSQWLKALLADSTAGTPSCIPHRILSRVGRLAICRAASLKERMVGVSRFFTGNSSTNPTPPAQVDGVDTVSVSSTGHEGPLQVEYIEDPSALIDALRLSPNSLRACSLPVGVALSVMADPHSVEKVPSLVSLGLAPPLADVARQLLCGLYDVATRVNCLSVTQNLIGAFREDSVEWFRQFAKYGGAAAAEALNPSHGNAPDASAFTSATISRLSGAPWGFPDDATQDQRARFAAILSVAYKEISVPRSPAHWPVVSLKTIPLRPMLRVALGTLWLSLEGGGGGVGGSGEEGDWFAYLTTDHGDNQQEGTRPLGIQLMAAAALLLLELTRFAANPTEQAVRIAVLEAATSIIGARSAVASPQIADMAEGMVSLCWPRNYQAANASALMLTGAPQALLALMATR